MSWAWLALPVALSGCGEVVDVLHGAAGEGGRAPVSGAGGVAGAGAVPSAGRGGGAGAEPATEDPALGVFVDAGDSHACVARYGVLYCWGAGADGRLGNGDAADHFTPTRVGADADWIAVATGVAHTCALKTNGSVWCFGDSKEGQLGQGNTAAASEPRLVALPAKAVQLSSEARTACVVLETGELWCWGYNWEGGIGLDDQHPGVNQLAPVRSGDQSDWTWVGTGDGHTCGVRRPGRLFAWGRNSSANLGLGSTTDSQRRVATAVGTDEDWQTVVAGQDSGCGLRAGGRLYCWGGNSFGNLGLGDDELRLSPTEVAASHSWAEVAIDTFHACGIDDQRALYCWGRATEGQLGTGDNTDRLEPSPIESDRRFAQVVVGRMFSCAVTTDDAVLCTGENVAGQLGSGDAQRRNRFSELAFP